MTTAHTPEHFQELAITLELVSGEGGDDPALINAIGYETLMTLQEGGYKTRPAAYSEEKGAGFLIELVTTAQQITTALWNNHAIIAEGIADLSGLVTIFTVIIPILKQVRQAHKKQMGKEGSTAHPIKVTVEIDGASVGIEASDLVHADAALQLALKYCAAHPAAATQATTKSKAKVRGQIPARKRRPRR